MSSALEEQVHQHRLAAPDPAPQIDAARRLGLRPSEPPEQAAASRRRFKLGLRAGSSRSAAARLLGIGPEFARRDQRVVAIDERRSSAAAGALAACVPEKVRTMWSSSCPARPGRAGRQPPGLAHQFDHGVQRLIRSRPAPMNWVGQIERHRMRRLRARRRMRPPANSAMSMKRQQCRRHGSLSPRFECVCARGSCARAPADGHRRSAARGAPTAAR